MVSKKIYLLFLMNIFLNGTIEPFLKMHKLFIFHSLQEEPRPANSLQMKGGQGFRLRIGDYRVLYDIDDSSKLINLRRIGHRREIYRDL
jgi:mRNA-degrading endonuclease RelE of RelBE toxin-antitoxin system